MAWQSAQHTPSDSKTRERRGKFAIGSQRLATFDTDIAVANVPTVLNFFDHKYLINLTFGYGTLPHEGWKIHVSAFPETAQAVADLALPVLHACKCSYKLLRTPAHVNQFYEGTQTGKFITVYTASLQQATTTAMQLCHVLGNVAPNDDVVRSKNVYRHSNGRISRLIGPRISNDLVLMHGAMPVFVRWGSYFDDYVQGPRGFYRESPLNPVQQDQVADKRNGAYKPDWIPAWPNGPVEPWPQHSWHSKMKYNGFTRFDLEQRCWVKH